MENFIAAFRKNTSVWHSILHKRPVGWGKRAQRRLRAVLIDANRYVQDLNDKFTNPSGRAYLSPNRLMKRRSPKKSVSDAGMRLRTWVGESGYLTQSSACSLSCSL